MTLHPTPSVDMIFEDNQIHIDTDMTLTNTPPNIKSNEEACSYATSNS